MPNDILRKLAAAGASAAEMEPDQDDQAAEPIMPAMREADAARSLRKKAAEGYAEQPVHNAPGRGAAKRKPAPKKHEPEPRHRSAPDWTRKSPVGRWHERAHIVLDPGPREAPGPRRGKR